MFTRTPCIQWAGREKTWTYSKEAPPPLCSTGVLGVNTTSSQGILYPTGKAPGHALQGPVLSYCLVPNPKSPKGLWPCGFLSGPLNPWFPPVVLQNLCADTSCLPAPDSSFQHG